MPGCCFVSVLSRSRMPSVLANFILISLVSRFSIATANSSEDGLG